MTHARLQLAILFKVEQFNCISSSYNSLIHMYDTYQNKDTAKIHQACLYCYDTKHLSKRFQLSNDILQTSISIIC